MESNSTAEPFAMVCSRCAIVRRESRVYGSDVARARAKQSAARLFNSSDCQTTPEPFLLFAQLDVGILDDLRPFGDVGVDDGGEFVW
jgi:ribosomal protein L36